MRSRVEGSRPARPVFCPEHTRAIVEQTPLVTAAVKKRGKKA